MPRPLSWLPRLAEIRRALQNSARSHYGRRDLERLFELQPRAAQKLLEALPTVQVGTSHLVEREALLALLERMQEAEDPAAALTESRKKTAAPVRRTLRQLVPHDLPEASWETLPASLTLAPGELGVTFTRIEELAAALVALASLLDRDLEGFAERYEPRPVPVPDGEHQDFEALFEDLKQLEAKYGY